MTENTPAQTPLVGIIMGSKSDLSVMEGCAAELERLGVPYELVVASAHRNPAKVHEWAESAADRGIRVIVAAAGKAAHLGGVVAAFTPLPVIGVPIKTSDLGGLDSLLSMVQMPSGVPVACVSPSPNHSSSRRLVSPGRTMSRRPKQRSSWLPPAWMRLALRFPRARQRALKRLVRRPPRARLGACLRFRR